MKLLHALLLGAGTLAVASSAGLAAPMPSPSPSPLLLPTYGPGKPQAPVPVLKKEGNVLPQPAGEETPGPNGEKKEVAKEGEQKEGPLPPKEEAAGSGPGSGSSPLDEALHSDGPPPANGNGDGDAPGDGSGSGDAPTRRSRPNWRDPKRLIIMTSTVRPPPPLWVKRPDY